MATINPHVLVTLVPRDTLEVIRLKATYHDEAEKRNSRWWVTKSFSQYLATDATPRALPPADS